MAVYRPAIPPHIAEIIRHLPPELKRSVKLALRSLSADPLLGAPLMRELSGLRKFRVRRYRIVYELDRKEKIMRIFAIGHRSNLYEELADQMRRLAENK